MGLFNDPNEQKRRENLRILEDKRLAFAQRLQREGFAPETMALFSTERGGLIGLCRHQGRVGLIVGPDFGADGDFTLEQYDALPVRFEEYFEKSEGMGGIFGMGKRGAVGFYVIAQRPDGELAIPCVMNKNSAAVFSLKKNPLLSVRRRRGDAHVVWDLPPVEKRRLSEMERLVRGILG